MLGWLAEVAQSIVAMLPVAAAVVTLLTSALGFYGQYIIFSRVAFGIAGYLSGAIGALTSKISSLGANKPLLITICQVVSLDTFIQVLTSILTVVGTVVAALVVALEGIATILIAVYVYQKVKLFANMLAVKGANE